VGKVDAHVPIPLSTLQDNYDQVYRYTLAQERRLAKQERTEEFNVEFYKTVERGMSREIGPEEMAAWDGTVNYISMVEACKEGPQLTTPLRIWQPETAQASVSVLSLSTIAS
jgi:hypothetical protein